jgi:hypothetical protein
MIRSVRNRVGVLTGIVALTATTVGLLAAPAGGATTNPCKVLKKSEIQQAFGGTVSRGKKGLSTPVSSQCEFQVSADADRPAGTVTIHVMTTGGKAAYTGLKKITSSYTPIEGVPDALWAEKLHVVNILEGSALLGVQGGFLVTEPLPLHFYDDQTQLTDLAQIGAKRV